MYISERLARETGKEYALRVIRENIIKLELSPGMVVSANELATELGVSRTPIREALNELSKIGIVEIYPQSGSRIANVDYDLVDESRFLRITLECEITKTVCKVADKNDLLLLKENVKLQEFYLENDMKEKLLELDNEFHRMLFQITNKMIIYELIRSFSIHFDRIRSMTMIAVKELKIVEDHSLILEAIQNKDEAMAQQLMDKHLSRYKFDVEEIKLQYPDYFK
ncbi:MAG: GntR family transcriptional regulator [Lachnotalea sp.]